MPTIPYNPAAPSSPEVFVGRTTVMQQLVGGLREGKNFSLAGAAGLGKTTLLHAVQRGLLSAPNEVQLSQFQLPVYVSILRHHRNLGEVTVHVFQAIARALFEHQNLPAPQEHEQWCMEADRGRLGYALRRLFSWAFEQSKASYRPILLLDDLHRLEHKSLLFELMSILQTTINLNELGMSLLLAGRHTLSPEWHGDTSPLRLLISRHFPLGNLSLEDTRLLVSKASDSGWSVEPDCGDIAFRITSGHPYRIHYYLYALLADEGKITCASLNSLHNTETETYLNMLLHDEVGREVFLGPSLTVIDPEISSQIRGLVRQDDLESALGLLGSVSRLQDETDLLAQKLSYIHSQERRGLWTHDSTSIGRTGIAHAILMLLNP